MRSRSASRTLVRFAVFCGVTAGSLVALPAAAEAAVDPSTTSFVTLNTGAGPWADAERTRLWRSDVDQVEIYAWSGTLQAKVNRAGAVNDWSVVSLRPDGGQFVAGTEYTADCTSGCMGTQMYIQEPDSDETCHGKGRFQVHAANEDLSSVWATYQITCDWRTFFGEIRRNHPGTGSAFVVGERSVWPTQYVGYPAGAAAFTVVNTGAQTLPLSEVAITAGEADFALVGSPCTEIPAGGSCVLTVRHTPIGEGDRPGSLQFRLGDAEYSTALSGTGALGHTEWNSWAEEVEGYHRGLVLDVDPSNARLDVSGDANNLSFALSGTQRRTAKLYCDLAGSGTCGPMQMEYENCYDGAQGETTVHEAVFENEAIARLSLTYRHRCNGATGWEYGSIAWHATAPAQPLPGIAGTDPAPLRSFAAQAGYSSAHLSWMLPLVADWDQVQVWFKPGSTASTLPGEAGSYLAYKGRAGESTLPGLHPNNNYAFAAFVKDAEGRWSTRSTAVLKASKLTLKVSSTKVVYGDGVTVTGKFAGQPYTYVDVAAHRPGTDVWYLVDTVSTDANGTFYLYDNPAFTYDYYAFFNGSGTRMGANAVPVRVTVAKDVVAWTEKSSGRVGTTFKIAAGVNPVAKGKTITLERYVDGKWRKVKSAKTGGTKPTYFSIEPTSRGTHTSRVITGAGGGLAAGKSVSIKIKAT